MAFDAYIQIDTIPGEALDEKYKKWIEVIGYDFGVSQSTSATASSAGGATSGRTTVTNFTFRKYLDSASC
ncbi:type VI secretion system tube protein Hcp, partial [Pseudomonas putida]